jgi:hypothetical protein
MQNKKPEMVKPNLNIIEKMNAAFTDELITRPFPVERLSPTWIMEALKALSIASPYSMGISAQEMRKLHALSQSDLAVPPITYFQFAMLSNNLEQRSAWELGLDMEYYLDLMDEAATHVDFFREQHALIKKEVELRVANEEAGKNINLKAITAEA